MKNKFYKWAFLFVLLMSIHFTEPVEAASDWSTDVPDTQVANIAERYSKDSDGYYYLSYIYLQSYMYYDEDCNDEIKITTSSSNFKCVEEYGNIEFYAKKAGSYTYTIEIDGTSVTANYIVIDMDGDAAILKDETYQIVGAKSSSYLAFSSSDTSVAKVSSAGKVTGKGAGTATIYAYEVNGSSKTNIGYLQVYVADPKISTTSLSMNIYNAYTIDSYYYTDNNYVEITGVPYGSSVTVKTSSSNLKCEYSVWDTASFYLYPKKTGSYTVTITVNGKQFTVKVSVYKLYFKLNSKNIVTSSTTWDTDYSCILLYKGDTANLTIKGVPSGATVKYKSSNKKVATVNSSGKITGKGLGKATITATVNGNSISYPVEVSYKKSVLACRYAKKYFGANYSQDKRMSKGYYDCSSWVWRSYESAKSYVGPSKSWAPTAADMAKWCEDNGYIIYDASTSGSVDMSKLLPGDLIFECGSSNGRYKGIYHVDLYQGNYSATSVNRIKQYWYNLSNVMIARPCLTKNATPKLTSTSKKKIVLAWSETYGADGYQIYRSTSKNGTYKKIKTVKSTTTYTDSGLKSKKTYYYKVRSYWSNTNGSKKYGKFSDIVSIKAK